MVRHGVVATLGEEVERLVLPNLVASDRDLVEGVEESELVVGELESEGLDYLHVEVGDRVGT